jgi:hypothetical protein
MKIGLVEAELLHAEKQADGQTEITKQIIAFRYYANAPKTSYE